MRCTIAGRDECISKFKTTVTKSLVIFHFTGISFELKFHFHFSQVTGLEAYNFYEAQNKTISVALNEMTL